MNVAPIAAGNLGLLRMEQGDEVGADAAYQFALDSGHVEMVPLARIQLQNLGVVQ